MSETDEAHLRAVERELGTRDLGEANRRTRMVWDWKREQERSADA